MTMTAREFFNTKPTVVEYMTLDLYHSAFGYLRLVKNQYFEMTFAGETYQPCAMTYTESTHDDTGEVSYTINLGRVGIEAKAMIKAIQNTQYGWMESIQATISHYLSTDTDNPYRTPVTLTVGTITMEADAVAITIDTGDPKSKAVARRYTTDDFPGLASSYS
jgi:hypothetical protein